MIGSSFSGVVKCRPNDEYPCMKMYGACVPAADGSGGARVAVPPNPLPTHPEPTSPTRGRRAHQKHAHFAGVLKELALQLSAVKISVLDRVLHALSQRVEKIHVGHSIRRRGVAAEVQRGFHLYLSKRPPRAIRVSRQGKISTRASA